MKNLKKILSVSVSVFVCLFYVYSQSNQTSSMTLNSRLRSTSLSENLSSNSNSKTNSYNSYNSENPDEYDLTELPFEEFQNKTQLANASEDYLVTAGDVYQLAYAVGSNAVTYTISVDSSYMIRVANLATINGAGKTFVQLRQQVEDVVNRNYPMGGVQFFILTPSTFKVIVKGEVKSTQIKQTWALNRLSSLLDDRILTDSASKRFITVVSKNGKSTTYDLFKANRDGDLSQNPYLRPEDTIIIPKYERKVTISGAVERPESYELAEGENFKALVEKYAGGLTYRADRGRTEISRNFDAIGSSGKKIYLKENVFEEDYTLLDNDSVFISSYDDFLQVVFLEGAVGVDQENTTLESSNKLSIDFSEGENYAFFIRRNRDVFSSVSDLQNAYIRRGNEIIPINLEEILYDSSSSSSLIVTSYDTIIVPFRQLFVTVSGAVKVPGRFPYVPDRTYEYYIGLAGGFDKDQNNNDAVKIYDINMNRYSKDEFITPESTITAQTTAFSYYFNKYAPVVTTVLSAVSTTISVLAACGVFTR